MKTELEINKEVYAGNIQKYLTSEEKSIKAITKGNDYANPREKTINLNRIKKRSEKADEELKKLGVKGKLAKAATEKKVAVSIKWFYWSLGSAS